MLHGFRGAPGKVESGPAKHLRAALGQVVNFFYTLQGEAAGAQAFSSFDTYLAPFIRRDGLDYAEVKQALQEFVFNLNVPTRVGFQTPFTNVTLDWNVPTSLAHQPVIWGGEYQSETYGDFQTEMDLFNRAFLEVLGEGDARGRVFSFPIPTYNITQDFDYEDPRLEPLWVAAARYGIPYFANFVGSELSPDDARSMCCRLRLDTRELARRGGGLFGAQPLTGSIGVVTLNLPRIGHVARTDAEFFAELDRLLRLCVESLEVKRKVLERLTDDNLYPYVRYYLRGIKEAHRELLDESLRDDWPCGHERSGSGVVWREPRVGAWATFSGFPCSITCVNVCSKYSSKPHTFTISKLRLLKGRATDSPNSTVNGSRIFAPPLPV